MLSMLSMLVRSHVVGYPVPSNITYLWNLGFMLFFSLVLQVISGVLLTCFYDNTEMFAFGSIYSLIMESNMGWLLRYTHSNFASLVMFLLYSHILKAWWVRSGLSLSDMYLSGFLLFVIIMGVCFLGYVLTWGQLSYWGATVITSMLSCVPALFEAIMGNFYVSGVVLSRFLAFHYILAFFTILLVVLHFFYLHYSGSSTVRVAPTNRVIFLSYVLSKDLAGLLLFLALASLLVSFGLFTVSHSDNSLVVDSMVTPIHIVPEWYFLQVYAILKCFPHKILGLISLIMYLIICSLHSVRCDNVWHSVLSVLCSLLLFWLGAQLPTNVYVSLARILSALLLLISLAGLSLKCFSGCRVSVSSVVRLSNDMLLVITFLITVTLGGVTGVILGNNGVDISLHDTYYVVAHFHFVLSLGTGISLVLSLVHFQQEVGYNSFLSFNSANIRGFVLVLFAGVMCTFVPMHMLGFYILPRRICDYSHGCSGLSMIASMGSILTISAFFLLNCFARCGEHSNAEAVKPRSRFDDVKS